MTEKNPTHCPADDAVRKPIFRRDPGAYVRRRIRLQLNDLLAGIGLRVFDRVEMTAIRTTTVFNHLIDVGVSYGTPDLYARFPGAEIELFEPSPQFHQGLETGVMRQRRCRLHKVALGAHSGEATLHLSGAASASLLGTQTKPGRTFPTVSVPVRRLDELFLSTDLKRPALLKVDTEGYELAVLQGAELLLPHIDALIIEVHFDKAYAYQPQQILDLTGRHGFSLIDVLDHEVRNGRVTCCDMVFERL